MMFMINIRIFWCINRVIEVIDTLPATSTEWNNTLNLYELESAAYFPSCRGLTSSCRYTCASAGGSCTGGRRRGFVLFGFPRVHYYYFANPSYQFTIYCNMTIR